MRVLGINNSIVFQRRPKPVEEIELQTTINIAYDAIGTKERIVITHGSCFPSMYRNSFIGSPYGKSAEEYIKFLMLYGFNGNQLGPGGELQFVDNRVHPSPYNSSAFAKNKLFIDLEELTTDKYARILSTNTFNNVTKIPEKTKKNYDETDFNEALKTYNTALNESYKNFKVKVQNGNPQAIKLNKEFNKFLNKHNTRLTNEGMFKILSKHYGTDEFEKWNNKLDEDLIRQVKLKNPDAQNRYNELLKYNKNEINLYKFEQFIATKQIRENREWREQRGFKYFNDLLVGCSLMDYWRCRDAFVEGYQLGCPMGEGNNPQAWNIPVINPRKLFVDDGLGVAGKFLKDKIDYALEFCENVRIDHAMGLIEPFVVENKSIVYNEEKNIANDPYKNPVNGHYMSEMYSSEGQKLDDYRNFSCEFKHPDGGKTYHSNIMNKIVLPTLIEHGISPQDVVWEDICSNPEAFNKVFYENLNLPGLSQLEFAKVQNSPSKNWFVVGSHDSIPAHKMLERDWTRNGEFWNVLYLAGFLNQDPLRADERDKFCKKIEKNDHERINAKFAELLTTEKFQISFADLLGITETLYNEAGTINKSNWKERIPSDFLDKYYENLSSKNPTALNIPEILKTALQAKIDMKIVNSPNKEEIRQELYEKYQPILDSLQKYADILKEPEDED